MQIAVQSVIAEARELVQVEAGVFALGFGSGVGGWLVQALQGCGGQAFAAAFTLLLCGF